MSDGEKGKIVVVFFSNRTDVSLEMGKKKKQVYLKRFGAQTIAKFFACMFVMVQ